MGTKVFLLAVIFSMGFLLLSCEDRLDTIPKEIDASPSNNILDDKKEDYETMYMMQTNPGLILADRIISKGAGFVLDISKEEASELQIPDELYQEFTNRVNELNKQNVKNEMK